MVVVNKALSELDFKSFENPIGSHSEFASNFSKHASELSMPLDSSSAVAIQNNIK